MPPPQPVPTVLIELGREAVEAVASTEDMATFRGAALLNPSGMRSSSHFRHTKPRRTPYLWYHS